ncbi:type IX secretion system outer membrane channel protein PorV [Chryseobacterium sp. PTM-20240506]|uniref:type IX secretion system outer membrane channel protein PorV n=1 Tax=unclassified Chryseobacterium TaxID=2593645 RepID=UPI001554A879|nr:MULTISPECIES: type IX secretion system outer membrane channel protein PorV [unclassified Chryseobacterium]MDC8103080.1 type IX secretion system outer membrane channel protein PorV [Chryseobacterium sp. B21-037]MDQ1802629.1 type IX secretion system outer membrane channel protein PorV [Chryseobacterium sp. CKR4-1]WBV56641.1 type IX secretion system outer membrane channel protein PorV [Chryseobacterium daecheongense]
MNLTTKLLLGIGLSAGFLGYSQDLGQVRPVLTGAPFLRIAPDARSGGMGDQGVVTSPDAFSQFWNAAKYPFSRTSSSVGLNYTPYMGKLTNDVFLLYGAFHKFLGQDERSTISASIYYFNMGQVDLTQLVGSEVASMGTSKPNEFSIDVAYGLKLSDSYSMAVTGRFIRSDLAGGFNTDTTLKPANSFAVDVSGYYTSPRFSSIGGYDGKVNAGFAIQNLGPKLDYTGNEESRSYLPTMARLGVGYDMYLDDLNKIGISVEGSKILVPGSEFVGMDPNTRQPMYAVPNVGPIAGIGKSFKNKNSIMYSGALEYSYDNAFAVRTGYFRESPEQGAREFATAGIGLKYRSFGLDISYLINMSKINTALDNTLRFGLTWNIGDETSNVDN